MRISPSWEMRNWCKRCKREHTGSDEKSQREKWGFLPHEKWEIEGIILLMTFEFVLEKWAWFCQQNKGKVFWRMFQEFLECAESKGRKEQGEFVECIAVAWGWVPAQEASEQAVGQAGEIPTCRAEEFRLSWTEELTLQRSLMSTSAKY